MNTPTSQKTNIDRKMKKNKLILYGRAKTVAVSALASKRKIDIGVESEEF